LGRDETAAIGSGGDREATGMATSTPTQSTQRTPLYRGTPERREPGPSATILPLLAYFAVLLLLLLAFIVVGFYVVSQPVPGPG
jgi:hypothetical protein